MPAQINFSYRLGLDLGTNSIGWAMLKLDEANEPCGVVRMGARIFSDGRMPKTGESLAATRTKARSQRTRRERFLSRRDSLLAKLTAIGLFPDKDDEVHRRNLATLNPYELRAKALTEKLHPWHLGRALLHLGKRRGFKSNRLSGSDEDAATTGPGIQRLESALGEQQAATLGQLLYRRLGEKKSIRFRPDEQKPKDEKFTFYPTRGMYADEFAAIRAKQAPLQSINDADWQELHDIIFDQLPLKPQPRGGCRFLKDKDGVPLPRGSLALASFQEFRILSDACHLRYKLSPFGPPMPLTVEQRGKLLGILRNQGTVGFDSLRDKLGLPEEACFNIQSGKREELVGDKVGKVLSAKGLFGSHWYKLSLSERDAIVEKLLTIDDAEQLRIYAEANWGLPQESAQALATMPRKKLPHGMAPFSREFLQNIVPVLEAGLRTREGITYTDAVKVLSQKLGFEDQLLPADGTEPRLPYYGQAMVESCVRVPNSRVPEEKRFGRFPNPTVHIALNQLRLVVNTIIEKYGKPAQISVELARDLKLSREERAEMERQQAQNQRDNKVRNSIIAEIAAERGIELTADYDNRLRIRLWEEQQDGAVHFCPYTGKTIPRSILFSDAVEIDHVLPFAATHNDSPANKVLCYREANRDKRKRAPHEAFANNPGYDWANIEQLACKLPRNKQWRFAPDAMDKFKDEAGFTQKQLHDTRHLSRAARRYLTTICPENQVNVCPGRLTALLRHHWGLETILVPDGEADRIGKNRADHRHHAIDALTVALADRRTLQQITLANQNDTLPRIVVPAPWPTFRDEAKIAVNCIIVSHRPDHNPAGALHEDKFYGPVREIPDDAKHASWRKERSWEQEHKYDLVYRVGIEGITHANLDLNSTKAGCVRDRKLREKLISCLAHVPVEPTGGNEPSEAKKARLAAWAKALADFSRETGVRTVRLVKKKVSVPLPHDGHSMPRTVITGEIHHITLWKLPDNKVVAIPVSILEANNPDYHEPRPQSADNSGKMRDNPTATKLFKIHKGDFLRTRHNDQIKTVCVISLSPVNGNLQCQPVNIATTGEGDKFKIQFTRILITQTRLINISPIGDVQDSGPRQ